MTFNNGVDDNSQQEIVLDPESLEPGATYDLRVYVCNGSGQNRQVNLAFAGDGQAPVETGFFNEDDATTSAGGFTDPNQVYILIIATHGMENRYRELRSRKNQAAFRSVCTRSQIR